MNPMAEAVIGGKLADVLDKEVSEIFQLVDEQSPLPMENPVITALRKNIEIELTDHTLLITKQGKGLPMDWHGFDQTEMSKEDQNAFGPGGAGYGAYLVK